jgi:murein L,D-transpeptidase YcbB/YkuD
VNTAGRAPRVAILTGVVLSLFAATTAPRGQQTSFRALVAPLVDGREAWLGQRSRDERSDLQGLYASVDAPLWFDSAGMPTPNVRDALAVLRQAADEGLDPADYQADRLTRLTPRAGTPAPDAPERARLDVALSASVLRYLRDVHLGRVDPQTVGFRLDAPRDPHDFPSLLRDALAGGRVADLVDDLRPPLAQYRLLRTMLPRFRSLAADPVLSGSAPLAEPIHPGDESDAVGVLRNVLIALGDLAAAAPTTGRYDGPIVAAVQRFQRRHGLDADGIVGTRTIAALRVPAASRVRQIELALERLRWLPDLRDDRLLALNIPMFRLWAWERVPPTGQPLAMNVIVGRALRNQTPIFDEEMREVVFRPYWNVPRSILLNEVLPAIQRNPAYLRRENMEIVRGPGDAAPRVPLSAEALEGLRRGTLRVRQRPGPNNALGLIKFVFPNRESVYMHGTPAQTLFARSRRDFSHGCVRVEDPVALAEWVLRDRPEWTRDAILNAMQGTRTIDVPLPRPIQVILFYTTAVVLPEDGTIHFVDDIYRHDARLDRALDAVRQGRERGIFRPAGKISRLRFPHRRNQA